MVAKIGIKPFQKVLDDIFPKMGQLEGFSEESLRGKMMDLFSQTYDMEEYKEWATFEDQVDYTFHAFESWLAIEIGSEEKAAKYCLPLFSLETENMLKESLAELKRNNKENRKILPFRIK